MSSPMTPSCGCNSPRPSGFRSQADYTWPMVEGLSRLVRVRRRQDAGTTEIAARYPDLMKHEDKARPDIRRWPGRSR